MLALRQVKTLAAAMAAVIVTAAFAAAELMPAPQSAPISEPPEQEPAAQAPVQAIAAPAPQSEPISEPPEPEPAAQAPVQAAAAPPPEGPVKAAVYVTGLPAMVSKTLNSAIGSALMKSKIYAGIVSVDKFVSGAANNASLINAGTQAGVSYIFAIEAGGKTSVRIIDVHSATELAKISIDGKITAVNAAGTAKKIVDFILKSGPKHRQGAPEAKQSAGSVAGVPSPSYGTLTDKRDNTSYKTIKIGRQTWMAENLNHQTENSACYANDASNCEKYGRLYNWPAAQKACPAGWRLPSNDEWAMLSDYSGGSKAAGGTLKSTSGWWGNGNGTDKYGFSALPGGSGLSGGEFVNTGNGGNWWSATESNSDNAYSRNMVYHNDSVSRNSTGKTVLFSVRCVQD